MKNLKIIKTEYQRIGYDEGDIDKSEYTELEASYNEAGQLVREERFDPNGALNTLTLNSYNEAGQLTQTEQYDQDHILLQKSVNTYGDNGLLETQSNYFGEGETEYVSKFVYDPDGHLIRQEMYDNGKLDYVEREMHYQNGLLIKEFENDDYGKTLNIHTYEYNGQGLVSKYIRDEVQNKDRRTHEFTYDEQGNCVKELVYDFNDMLIAKTYRTYDDENRLVDTETEDLDNYRKITMEYDGDRVVRNSIVDKEGQLKGWAEYTYDEGGKENSSKEFIQDEVKPDHFRMLRETHYERS